MIDHCTNPAGLLVVISGPSGVGKTTIAREIERRLNGVFSVSVTTRPKAPADVEGRDYSFLTEQQFIAKRDAGELLEWAELFGRYKYGTPRKPVEEHLAAGRLVILEIDVQGGLQVKKKIPEALMIFVLPPKDEALLKRLRARGRETEEVIQHRLAQARREIETARASGAYDHFVVNDDLQTSIDACCSLVRQRQDSFRPVGGEL